MRATKMLTLVLALMLGLMPGVGASAEPRLVDDGLIASEAELKALQAEIDLFDGGNRPAGSQAELDYIDHLDGQLSDLGVTTEKKPFVFDRWNPPENFSLDILEGPAAGSVNVAAYVPFSGVGDATGIVAPIVHVVIDPTTGALSDGNVTGKIVVLDVPPAPLPMATFHALSYYEHDPDDDLHPTDIYARTWVAQAGMWVILDRLTNLGAKGLVAILDLPEEAARGAYFPYDGKVRAVPGLYVDRTVGAHLKRVSNGVRARLVMDATVTKDSTSYNLEGYIPAAEGSPTADELIVLHSHTDGPNSIEDNGPPAVVALAKYFLAQPRAERPRTIMTLFTSGHFSGWVGIRAWIKQSAAISARIVTLISLEHLGAREYLPRADGSYGLTGRNEPGGIFVGENEPLVGESIALFKRENIQRHFVVRPFNPSTEHPGERGWPGEATEFEVAGITTVQYVTGPQYLLNWGVDTTNVFTDYNLMRRIVRGFAQFVHNIEHVPASVLTTDDPTTVGEPI